MRRSLNLDCPADNQIDVFTCIAEDLRVGEAQACWSTLTRDERTRVRRIARAEARQQSLVGCYLKRAALSLYTGITPSQWRFASNAFGRPEIDSPPQHRGLHLNLSHSHGVVTVAVARFDEIGIDVERIDRTVDMFGVASSVFTDQERARLAACAADQVADVFFTFWTLKEAYIKARGKGFSIPPQSFEVSIGEQIGLRTAPGCDASPRRWRFHLSQPTPRHRTAIAVGRTTIRTIRAFDCRPGHGGLLITGCRLKAFGARPAFAAALRGQPAMAPLH